MGSPSSGQMLFVQSSESEENPRPGRPGAASWAGLCARQLGPSGPVSRNGVSLLFLPFSVISPFSELGGTVELLQAGQGNVWGME